MHWRFRLVLEKGLGETTYINPCGKYNVYNDMARLDYGRLF